MNNETNRQAVVMKKTISVTVGIPAFNEEKNIEKLIQDIIDQDQGDFLLEKIIIASDGSTDATITKAQKFDSAIVQIFDNKERMGAATRMNQIIRNCHSDILVMLNGDIAIFDKFFIKKIIHPVVFDGADLVAASVSAVSSGKLVGKILQTNFDFRKNIFEEHEKGLNLYTCCGVGRAFSRRFYEQFLFTESVGEDAYSYLYCVCHGFKYSYAKNAEAHIKLPDNLADHKKQSLRFSDSKRRFYDNFGVAFVKEEYHLPARLMLKNILTSFCKRPILMVGSVAVIAYMRISFVFSKKIPSAWEISVSAKDPRIIKKEKKSILLRLGGLTSLRRTAYKLLNFLDNILLLRNKTVVLSYHSISEGEFYFGVSAENFKKQIDLLLDKGYVFITPADLQQFLESGIEKTAHPMCLLTFDDGYRDILAVKDFLAKKRIQPLMFVLSDEKNISREELAIDKDFLSAGEILELKNAGWIIGSHGSTHGNFNKLKGEKLDEEILGSKITLEKKLGFPVEYFAYPKGVYSQDILERVRAAGYGLAFSMDDGLINCHTPIFAIPRVGINRTHELDEFLATFSPSVVRFRAAIKAALKTLKNG